MEVPLLDSSDGAKPIQFDKLLKNIKELIKNNDKSKLEAYIEELENLLSYDTISYYEKESEKIQQLIRKHPYFKNPCSYPIRLLTIMKYLKKKGIDTRIEDIDLLVNRTVENMDGVSVTGPGMYIVKKS